MSICGACMPDNFPRIVNENANNRIESNFKIINKHFKLYFKGLTSIYEAIIHLTSWAEDMISTGLTKAKKIQTKNF